MHTLSGLVGLLLNLGVGTLSLRSLRSIRTWSSRRMAQLLILCLPGITLGVGLFCLYHLIDHLCTSVPAWDKFFGILIPALMLMVVSGALLVGIIRYTCMLLLLMRTQKMATPQLQRMGDALAQRVHLASPPIFCTPLDRPLAFTSGTRSPIIVLSSWMLHHLDQQELEAVLAHEMVHIAHHDSLIISVATMLRDAFFYLPPIHLVYQQLQQEKEVRGDERAIALTRRPLALASALTKVWLHTVDGSPRPLFCSGQHLVSDHHMIRERIERLLHPSAHEAPCAHPAVTRTVLFSSLSVFLFLLVTLIQLCIFCLFMLQLGCFPSFLMAQPF